MPRALTLDDLPELVKIVAKSVAQAITPLEQRIAGCEWWLGIKTWPLDFQGGFDPVKPYREGQSTIHGDRVWVLQVPESRGAIPGESSDWFAAGPIKLDDGTNVNPEDVPKWLGALTKKFYSIEGVD